MSTDLIGYIAGICLTVCFIPQIIKTWRTRDASDVSMWMLLMTLLAGILYQVYAWRLGLVPVLIMNGIFAVLVLVEILLKLKFERSAGN